jgi:hypothetical protein
MIILVFFYKVFYWEYFILYILLILLVLFVILWLFDYYIFINIEITIFSIIILNFIIFSLTNLWVNNDCSES